MIAAFREAALLEAGLLGGCTFVRHMAQMRRRAHQMIALDVRSKMHVFWEAKMAVGNVTGYGCERFGRFVIGDVSS